MTACNCDTDKMEAFDLNNELDMCLGDIEDAATTMMLTLEQMGQSITPEHGISREFGALDFLARQIHRLVDEAEKHGNALCDLARANETAAPGGDDAAGDDPGCVGGEHEQQNRQHP